LGCDELHLFGPLRRGVRRDGGEAVNGGCGR
jgi:hypothetical protein